MLIRTNSKPSHGSLVWDLETPGQMEVTFEKFLVCPIFPDKM